LINLLSTLISLIAYTYTHLNAVSLRTPNSSAPHARFVSLESKFVHSQVQFDRNVSHGGSSKQQARSVVQDTARPALYVEVRHLNWDAGVSSCRSKNSIELDFGMNRNDLSIIMDIIVGGFSGVLTPTEH